MNELTFTILVIFLCVLLALGVSLLWLKLLTRQDKKKEVKDGNIQEII